MSDEGGAVWRGRSGDPAGRPKGEPGADATIRPPAAWRGTRLQRPPRLLPQTCAEHRCHSAVRATVPPTLRLGEGRTHRQTVALSGEGRSREVPEMAENGAGPISETGRRQEEVAPEASRGGRDEHAEPRATGVGGVSGDAADRPGGRARTARPQGPGPGFRPERPGVAGLNVLTRADSSFDFISLNDVSPKFIFLLFRYI